MQSRKQVRLSTFIPPQRRPGPSRTSPPPHILRGRGGREKQNAHTRLCQQVVHQHSCTYKPCRQSHMLATRKHVTCQTLVQVQTCARPSISYAHTSHLDTRTRAPRGLTPAALAEALLATSPAASAARCRRTPDAATAHSSGARFASGTCRLSQTGKGVSACAASCSECCRACTAFSPRHPQPSPLLLLATQQLLPHGRRKPMRRVWPVSVEPCHSVRGLLRPTSPAWHTASGQRPRGVRWGWLCQLSWRWRMPRWRQAMGLASATVLAAGAGAAQLIRSLRRRRRDRVVRAPHRRQSAGHQLRRSAQGLAQWSAAAPTRAPAEVAAKEEASTAQRLLAQDVGGGRRHPARTMTCKHWREPSSGAGDASRERHGAFASGSWLRLGGFLHSHRLLQHVRVRRAEKAFFCVPFLLGCSATSALPSALAAVAVSGADTARVAIAPFGTGFAHIGPRGSRKPPRSQRAATPWRRTRSEAANAGPAAV